MMETRQQLVESRIREFAQQIGYSHVEGLYLEFRDFFLGNENVAEHNLTVTEEGQYRIWVKLCRYGPNEAHHVFRRLVSFVEYTGATFYVRTLGDRCIRYLLFSLSLSGSELSYFCEITFSA